MERGSERSAEQWDCVSEEKRTLLVRMRIAVILLLIVASARAAGKAEVTDTLTRGNVKVRYRERHISKTARAVDFTCTWLKGNRAETTECFMHAGEIN